MKKHYLYTLALTLFCIWIYGVGLFQLPVTDRDEALFAQASKQMIQTGNYDQIKVQDKNRHLKPPGIYWLQSAAVNIFDRGHTFHIGFFRLVSSIGAYLSALILFFGLRKFTSERKAFLSAMLLSCSLLLVGEAHLATTDAALLCTMVIMQVGLMMTYLTHHPKKGPFLFWGGMALGTLIKGLTPVVGLLTLASLIIIDRNPKLFFKTKPLQGIILFILVSLCWLIPISLATHSNFLWDMIHGDLLPKITGGQEGHGRFPGYFLALFPLIFWPGSILLIHGIARSVKHFKDPLTRFLLAWLVPTWILYEIIPTKLPEYVLPLFPAVATLIILGLSEKLGKNWKIAEWIIRFVWLLYSIVLFIALMLLPHIMRQSITDTQWITMISLAAMIIFASFYYHKKYFLLGIFVLSALFYPLLLSNFLPDLKNFWLSQKINQAIRQLPANNQTILAADYQEPSLIFYLGTDNVTFMPSDNALLQQLKPHQYGIIAQAPLDGFNTLKKITGFEYNGGHWRTLYVITSE